MHIVNIIDSIIHIVDSIIHIVESIIHIDSIMHIVDIVESIVHIVDSIIHIVDSIALIVDSIVHSPTSQSTAFFGSDHRKTHSFQDMAISSMHLLQVIVPHNTQRVSLV